MEECKGYCVYIPSCTDDSLYTGMTLDLDRRLSEHRAGRGARWTRRRRPVKLVFSLDGLSYRAACDVERYIKSLTRARKPLWREPKMLSLVDGSSQPLSRVHVFQARLARTAPEMGASPGGI
jgi:putative endonuclease